MNETKILEIQQTLSLNNTEYYFLRKFIKFILKSSPVNSSFLKNQTLFYKRFFKKRCGITKNKEISLQNLLLLDKHIQYFFYSKGDAAHYI